MLKRVVHTTRSMSGVERSQYLIVEVPQWEPVQDPERVANRFAQAVLEQYPEVADERLVVDLQTGYDILIAKSTHHAKFDHTLQQWRQLLGMSGSSEK